MDSILVDNFSLARVASALGVVLGRRTGGCESSIPRRQSPDVEPPVKCERSPRLVIGYPATQMSGFLLIVAVHFLHINVPCRQLTYRHLVWDIAAFLCYLNQNISKFQATRLEGLW